MIPPDFINFFIVSAGAGATLVGLIFVAVSIAPEHIVMAHAPIERRAMAASSFSALLNGFIISLGALIPHINLGYFILVMSITGGMNSLFLGWSLLKHRQSWLNLLRRTYLILASFIIYGYEFYYGLAILFAPNKTGAIYILAILLIIIYAVGLQRAWQLLGARRFGLSGWLSPLRDIDETMPLTREQSHSEGDALNVKILPEPYTDDKAHGERQKRES